MNIRAICTDIDGTLLNSDRELSARTIAAVKALNNKIPFILASSRMPSAMRHLQQELGILNQPMICFNGGYVLLFEEGSPNTPVVLDTVQIPASICQTIFDLSNGTDIHVSLYVNDEWHAPQQDQWTEREIRNTKVNPTISKIEEILSSWKSAESGAHKVMCMGSEEAIATMADALEKQFAEEIYVYRSKSTYLEIAPRSISKATALELLLKHSYDIPMAEVMAFGDNYNDIEMLQAVSHGIAVGNAREEVKAVAKEVTLPSIQDGVAVAIEKYLLQE
ncbi:Cof-type HAD-IIB family hydrolase [Rufibacter roseus]|uniref:Cof-type HAD-IIB family hydrolase n=1 Tax=Rufibacter roseus TaxID=1567108 RepID=A0ABW2DSK2_9BACT|nr:Cof-type HAD-IIB family hydrolase [Rufibacter roseus]